MRWLYSINDSIDMNLSKLQDIVRTEEPGKRVRHDLADEQQQHKQYDIFLKIIDIFSQIVTLRT